jgi:3-hydroxybutyryl-CoA dehydrogenase
MALEFRSVGVVGLGTMGAGIVEVFAKSGLRVVGVEPTEDALERGRDHLRRSTDRAVSRGRLSEADRDTLHGLVMFTTAMDDLADVDLVVEAVPERMDLKQVVFGAVDKVCRPDAVLATNTSSLSVTEIAAGTSRPGRVVGMHFFNPAPVLKLVEVVRTVVSDADAVDGVAELARRLGKSPVVLDDRAGFVTNALLFGYLNTAMRMYGSAFASREDLDTAMRAACGFPMGPLTLLDLIGLDTSYQILETMHAESRDRLHAPAPVLKQLVTAGLLGRKTGRGFYTYDKPASGTVVPDQRTPAPVTADGEVRARVMGTGQAADRLALQLRDASVILVADDEPADVVLVPAPEEGLVARSLVGTHEPQRVVGVRQVRRGDDVALIELVRTIGTDPSAVSAGRAALSQVGAPVVVGGDQPGGIVDALLLPYLNDAVRMVGDGYATPDDIDTAMTKGAGYPEGPISVLDGQGLDSVLTRLLRLQGITGEPGHLPAPMLEQLVAAGFVGGGRARGFRLLGER